MTIKRIHYLWVGLSCFLIVLSRGAYSASVRPPDTQEHDFDLGPLQCCPSPRSEICPNLSDNVPCTVVNDLTARENKINSTLQTFNHPSIDKACYGNIQEILCKQYFPACVVNSDGTHLVQQPARTQCEAKLKSCPAHLVSSSTYCSLYTNNSVNYSISNCSASVPTKLGLDHCTVDWYLPEWIHPYLKKIDEELEATRGVLLTQTCWEKLRDFRCKSVGRCWAQGDRLEHINSIETCQELMRW